MSPMSRVRTLASSAAPVRTRMARPAMSTTRLSTGEYSGGASTLARAGASEGATGRPLAAFSGVCDSSATPSPSVRLLLEHHRWRGEIDAAGQDPRLQKLRERRALLGRHARHAVHQVALHRRRRAAEHRLSGWRERDLYAS